MKWPLRLVVILAAVLLLAGIAGMVFLVNSRMETNEYLFQVDAVLSAARVANGGEALTEESRAVIAEYEGQRYVIVPGNYTALASYLHRDPARPLLVSLKEEEALRITFCGEAMLLAVPADSSGDRVILRFTSGGKTLTMHLRGGNLWPNLLACCTVGSYHDQNIPLD